MDSTADESSMCILEQHAFGENRGMKMIVQCRPNLGAFGCGATTRAGFGGPSVCRYMADVTIDFLASPSVRPCVESSIQRRASMTESILYEDTITPRSSRARSRGVQAKFAAFTGESHHGNSVPSVVGKSMIEPALFTQEDLNVGSDACSSHGRQRTINPGPYRSTFPSHL